MGTGEDRESGEDRVVEALIARAREGDDQASEELFARTYADMRAVAGAMFRGQGAGHTLQPTALVHEAWLKIERAGAVERVADRSHFIAVAARAMRQVLVNHARDATAAKRGGPGQQRVTLSGLSSRSRELDADVLAVNEALEELASADPRSARIAELRFFGGLTNPEIAEALGVSLRTVELDWKVTKAWFAERLAGGDDSAP